MHIFLTFRKLKFLFIYNLFRTKLYFISLNFNIIQPKKIPKVKIKLDLL